MIAGERQSLVEGWSFHRGPAEVDARLEAGWKSVRLPHDWSIRGTPRESAPSAGGGGFFPTGEGWYARTLEVPVAWQERTVSLLFEGAYRNATVYLNGVKLATHANGYTPFRVPLDAALNYGEPNTLRVHVDNMPQPNSRWYSGSGLYRPVWLEVRHPVHVVPGSVVADTVALTADRATLRLSAAAANQREGDTALSLVFRLFDPDGMELGAVEKTSAVKAGETSSFVAKFEFTEAQPWSPDTPFLYTLQTEVRAEGKLLDQTETTFGLRTLAWSSQKGLLLNGQPVLLRGGNVHHDHGPLGAAAFPDAEERKVRLLREAGFNAVRTAHNPPSTAFLEACDRLGMLVIDEIFDGWKAKKTQHDYGELYDAHWEADLTAFIRRDRHHPSVIAWSIGNEVYERGHADGVRRAHALAALVRTLDRTRPLTIGLNGLGTGSDWGRLDPIFDGLDLAGYNYELEARHAADHARRPNRIQYASESYLGDAFTNWELTRQHPYIIGDFVWSAIDYLGEAGIGRVFPPGEEIRHHWEGSHFPWFGASCGDLDLIGHRKPISHYREMVWDEGPTLYAAIRRPAPAGGAWQLTQWSISPALASWTWPGHEDQILTLDVYSRAAEVQVILNGRKVAQGPTGKAHRYHAVLELPYEAGKLVVEAFDEEHDVVERFTLNTAGEPAEIELASASTLDAADPLSLAFVEVTVRDAKAGWVPGAEIPVSYEVEGPAEILAVGSGDLRTEEPFTANPRHTSQGRALVILRTTGERGVVTLTASAPGLPDARLQFNPPATAR